MKKKDMPCRETIEFIDQYLDDSMGAELRVRFETHLDICPYCRDYLQTYRETIRMAASLGPEVTDPPLDLPEELIKAVRDTLHQAE